MRHNTKSTPLTSRRLAGVITATLVTFSLTAQSVTPRPSLVVGITVEGLCDDYLRLLRDYFSKNGFNMLAGRGVTFQDIVYGPNIDALGASAMIFSGASASVSGIATATVFDNDKRVATATMADDKSFSPKALLVSTIADEIRLADGGINHVYAVAPDPGQAVILAGHAGNAALWISDINGNFNSSPYYKDVPIGVNSRPALSTRLDTMKWAPSMDVSRFPDIPSYKKAYPFRYVFQRKDPNRYKAFKSSAPVNREVTSVAINLINSMKLGKGNVTDMVNVAYTVAPYPYSKDSDSRLEQMDTYLRLDQDLSQLFRAIEDGPGLDRTLVFLTGIPASASGKRDDERFGIPHGLFSPRKAVSLLNMYIIAVHGNGDWVTGYHNCQFHLNRKLIKDRGLDLTQMRRETAEFLLRMSGICESYTIDDILARRAGTDSEALRRNTIASEAGDVFITVAPGWEIEADTQTSTNARPMVSRLATVTYPAYIIAPGVAAKTIDDPIDARTIAPTVARLLRIRSPNGASLSPLRLN